MSRRLYVGRLAPDATRRDIETFFDKYGTMTDVRIMNGFGFVEFENVKDAEDAVAEKNGEPLLGENVILEPAKEARRRDMYDGPRGGFDPRGGFPGGDRYGGPPPGASRFPPRVGRGRVIVKGISPGMSWQDLKDFGRDGGPVSFADVDRENEGQGIIEYPSLADAEDAIKKLDGTSVRGNVVSVVLADAEAGGMGGGGGGDYRGGGGDRYGGGGDRYGGGYSSYSSYDYRRDDRGFDRRDDRGYDRRDDRGYDRRDERPRYDDRRDERPRYDDRDDYYYSRRGDDRRGDDRDRRDDRDRYDDRRGPDRRDERRRSPEPARRERSPPPARRSRSPAPAGEKPSGWE